SHTTLLELFLAKVVMATDFLSQLSLSELLPASELSILESRFAAAGRADAESQAGMLVESGELTRWQAKKVLAGRTWFKLGKYILLEEIGVGRAGTVYKARHAVLGSLVALKVLLPELVGDPEQLARFRREAQIAAQLTHPNIIKCFDAETEGDRHFWIAEYIDGKDLEKWFDELGPLPARWTSECIRQTALGLQYAHEQGTIHRDVKPNNLIVTCDDVESFPHVKIVDFGVARLTHAGGDERLTGSVQTLGTIDYIAPEQARSSRSADIRADIFSLGCAAFKSLTGSLPFPGKTSLQRLAARISKKALPIQSLRSDLPDGLAAVIDKMLARDREDRQQTPGEVVEQIKPFAW
ncbi:MAG: serine/threonine protein kinase, partial [Planctomycetales bacterium]